MIFSLYHLYCRRIFPAGINFKLTENELYFNDLKRKNSFGQWSLSSESYADDFLWLSILLHTF